MAQGDKARERIAREATFAAINVIYENLTDAERRRFLDWQKQNVKPGGKVKAFDWPGLKPYLQALAERVSQSQR
jgi:hypothetical protein